jgi:hypothetical protein|tara:strand:+ start:69 stop:344 length:276 start_codon:yes stop_codon:yes gene_type:complete
VAFPVALNTQKKANSFPLLIVYLLEAKTQRRNDMANDTKLTKEQIEFVDRLLREAYKPIFEAPVPQHIVNLIYGVKEATELKSTTLKKRNL